MLPCRLLDRCKSCCRQRLDCVLCYLCCQANIYGTLTFKVIPNLYAPISDQAECPSRPQVRHLHHCMQRRRPHNARHTRIHGRNKTRMGKRWFFLKICHGQFEWVLGVYILQILPVTLVSSAGYENLWMGYAYYCPHTGHQGRKNKDFSLKISHGQSSGH